MAEHQKESFPTLALWWLSGAETEQLKLLPIVQRRYKLIGLSVLFLGIISILALTYGAFFTVNNWTVAVVFGMSGAILVVNLQQFMIASVFRGSSFLENLRRVTPRLVVAIVIAVSMAIPLELKIFEGSIQQEFLIEQLQKEKVLQSQIDIDLQKGVDLLDSAVRLKEDRMLAADADLRHEIIGKDTSHVPGYGLIAREKLEYYRAIRDDYQRAKDRLDSIRYYTAITMSNSRKNIEIAYNRPITIVDRLSIFSKVTLQDPRAQWLSLCIGLLFVVIATNPILMKALQGQDAYDRKILRAEQSEESPELSNAIGQEIKIEENGEHNQLFERSKIELTYVNYFLQMVKQLEIEANKKERKARDFFFQGMVFSVLGILMAIGIVLFWLNYFSARTFQTYYIYEMITGTSIILLIEFLGAWFLKQSRLLHEKAPHLLKIRAILDRYLLSYLAIQEFAGNDTKGTYLINLLRLLEKDLHFPDDLAGSVQSSFAQETFESLANLTETVKSLAKGK